MKQSQRVYHSDIHAYVDGELANEKRAVFEQSLQQDKSLQDDVCELRKIKQQMLEHYQKISVPKIPKPQAQPFNTRWAVAASFVAAFGLGFFVSSDSLLSSSYESSALVAAQNSTQKLLLHIDSNKPEKTHALLQKASALLQTQSHQSGMPKMEIEIVANDHGVELFEEGNPSREAIVKLLAQYDNLKLIACQKALKRRADEGKPLTMIEGVQTNTTAIDEIVNKMQKGWGYYKF